MNIIEESFVEKKKDKGNKAPKIILAIIILLVIIIIGIVITLAYIENSTLKLYINGEINSKVLEMLVFEGDTTYVPIRDIASYLGSIIVFPFKSITPICFLSFDTINLLSNIDF